MLYIVYISHSYFTVQITQLMCEWREMHRHQYNQALYFDGFDVLVQIYEFHIILRWIGHLTFDLIVHVGFAKLHAVNNDNKKELIFKCSLCKCMYTQNVGDLALLASFHCSL